MEFADILHQYDIPYVTEGSHHCRPGWVQINCPYCRSEKWHMGYSLSGGYMNCWVCGGHRPAKVLADITGEPYGKIAKMLTGIESSYIIPISKRGKLKLPKGLGPMQKAHRNYLRQRGYKPRHLESLWGLQGIGIASRLSWRIFIPFIKDGKTVSWTTRGLTDREPRYISAAAEEEALNAKELLYGADYAHNAVIVHEGQPDVWRTGPGAVCSGGTGFSRAQVLLIASYAVRAICFDSEPNAQQKASELCDMLSVFPGETYNVTLDAKDAGEAAPEETAELRRQFLT